jgi:membrane-anchored protein YejM (alkaline phosphatase superfamily)
MFNIVNRQDVTHTFLSASASALFFFIFHIILYFFYFIFISERERERERERILKKNVKLVEINLIYFLAQKVIYIYIYISSCFNLFNFPSLL